jgi:hypothetical protein
MKDIVGLAFRSEETAAMLCFRDVYSASVVSSLGNVRAALVTMWSSLGAINV